MVRYLAGCCTGIALVFTVAAWVLWRLDRDPPPDHLRKLAGS